MKIPEKRIAKAVKAAQENFWGEFAEHFPEIKTGDFYPDDSAAFDWACTKATTAWLKYNKPEPPERTIRLECYTCCLDRTQTLRQTKLGEISVRCQRCGCERPLQVKDIGYES